MLVAAVKLLNGGEELIGGNPANHLVVQHNVKKNKMKNNNNINTTPPTIWQCNTKSTRRTTTPKTTNPQQTKNT